MHKIWFIQEEEKSTSKNFYLSYFLHGNKLENYHKLAAKSLKPKIYK